VSDGEGYQLDEGDRQLVRSDVVKHETSGLMWVRFLWTFRLVAAGRPVSLLVVLRLRYGAGAGLSVDESQTGHPSVRDRIEGIRGRDMGWTQMMGEGNHDDPCGESV
jgi:hypothetical protein